ncbi:xanthine dehydrogenase small subunit [Caenispirillum bisanense]|uniref:Xanthine dehydrogenase small subunit n=1 Tax=Caenispirillum bisanense TaxID=414052 RepID=A0A286GAP6_9PROT|nr:xanthine dehydrogenase small subunit [Caenispirillum bisanense]SOD92580.1 xanthine dehydrogenase small subunit [Caenispirillum bisanense]
MRDTIRFALNGRPLAVDGVPSHTTLLQWLRADGLTATKEGCAEGDCGACTVLLGTPADGTLDWRAVNACLVLLPQVDGRAVVTAEGLAAADGTPHPVQSALAEAHATQCGYCSPGFTMALAALAQRPERDDTAILDAIAGNLCRCTGYRPIVEAARNLPQVDAPAADASLAARLSEWSSEGLAYSAGAGRFLAPVTLAEALRLRAAHPDAWVWAGGTDLGLRVTKRLEVPGTVLFLGRVAELRGLRESAEGLEIGAAVPYADALAALTDLAPAVGDLVRRIGAAQVRNMGTLAGNIATASPIGDSLPPLIALGATIDLASPAGRRTVAAEDFVTGYRQTVLRSDELIVAIRIPRPAPGTRVAAYKIAKRIDQDISTVSAAFALRVEAGRVTAMRVAFGGVAARPLRATVTEAVLLGKPWTADTVAAAKAAVAADISPMSDFRGSADYRRLVAANLLDRLYLETTESTAPARLEAL